MIAGKAHGEGERAREWESGRKGGRLESAGMMQSNLHTRDI